MGALTLVRTDQRAESRVEARLAGPHAEYLDGRRPLPGELVLCVQRMCMSEWSLAPLHEKVAWACPHAQPGNPPLGTTSYREIAPLTALCVPPGPARVDYTVEPWSRLETGFACRLTWPTTGNPTQRASTTVSSLARSRTPASLCSNAAGSALRIGFTGTAGTPNAVTMASSVSTAASTTLGTLCVSALSSSACPRSLPRSRVS
jgi:hypothetical protein